MGTKISAFTASATIADSDELPALVSGADRRVPRSVVIAKVDKLTTKGDILTRSSTGYDRQPIGANGTIPISDSTNALGWRWGSASALAGPIGGAVAIGYTFSTTTTNSDPGSGTLRLDSATQNGSVAIYADLLDSLAVDNTAVLDSLDDSTNSVKGLIRLVKADDQSKWIDFKLSAVVSHSGYRELTIAEYASSASSPFANGDSVVLCFTPCGDQGSPGASGGTFAVEYFADLGTTSSFILNCANSVRAFRCTPSANWTWSLTAVPYDASGILVWLVIEVNNAVGKTATLPSGGSWGVLGEPTWTSGVDIVTVYTRDGGTTSRWMLASPGA